MAHGIVHNWKHTWKHGWKHGTLTYGFFGENNPELTALIFLQSNALGPGTGTAQEAIETGISNDYSAVKIIRHGANNIGPPPSMVDEAVADLQPAQVFVGVNFPIDHAGVELKLGRVLDALNPNLWNIIVVAINGSGVEDEWNNPAYLIGGVPALTYLINTIRTDLTTLNSKLGLIVPIGGESDAGESPDHLDFDDNLQGIIINRLRGEFGPAPVVIPRLSEHSTAGGSSHTVIQNAYDFANRNTKVGVVNGTRFSLAVDNVHYNDAGLIALGAEIGAEYQRQRDGTVPASPRVVGIGAQSIGNSAQGTSPAMPVHQANDILLFLYSGNGNTNVATPSGGWAAVTGAPVHNPVAADARLEAWWLRASSGATPAPTTADVGGDGGKQGLIMVIRGCRTSGDPFTGTGTATAASGTAVSFPTLASTNANSLFMNVLAATYNATTSAQASGQANAGLTEVQEHVDRFNTASAAGLVVITGVNATADDPGATTTTLANAATQAKLTIVFSP